jgi:hypothetical protein
MESPTIQEWMQDHPVGLEMLWKGAAGNQLRFTRDTITGLVGVGLETMEERELVGRVISQHRSKSIELPVYEWSRPDLGLRLIARENFYNWKLSVISNYPIEADFSGLFHTTPPVEPDYTGNPLASVYFEGFPEDLVFGYYAESDKKTWSAEIGSDEAFWTTIFLILRARGAIREYRWNTKEEHRASLDARSKRNDERRQRDIDLSAQRIFVVKKPRTKEGKAYPEADILVLHLPAEIERLVHGGKLEVLCEPDGSQFGDWWRVGTIVTAFKDENDIMEALNKRELPFHGLTSDGRIIHLSEERLRSMKLRRKRNP